jgi:hypothetical protein
MMMIIIMFYIARVLKYTQLFTFYSLAARFVCLFISLITLERLHLPKIKEEKEVLTSCMTLAYNC